MYMPLNSIFTNVCDQFFTKFIMIQSGCMIGNQLVIYVKVTK